MRKYLLFCILLLTTVVALGQKKSRVDLISSERSQGFKRNGLDVIKVYKGVFQQDYSRLSSDSAYFYPQNNSFDAFGHVNINQGDTLNVYSDKLNYNGNTHVALLTDNVLLVDKDATLSTNYLTYNTATRIGTYTGGGKLVNKQNTLVSKNGYYFANSRDSYFRYNVVLTTNDANIKTDTLRYNSGSRIAYFYGPTHIMGKQDKDTLYTENGTYNTVTEQAFFGKRNLYTQGTKSLKGDSLFYDRMKGYGRAVKNITFNDNEQKITLKGDLGTYFKSEERAVVTRNAYVIIVTEEKDTTKVDTIAKQPVAKTKSNKQSASKAAPPNTIPVKALSTDVKEQATAVDSIRTPQKVKRDSIYISADTLETQIITYKKLKEVQERMRTAHIRDTVAIAKKAAALKRAASMSTAKHLIMAPPAPLPKDSSYLHRDFFGAPRVASADTTPKNKPSVVVAKKPARIVPPKNVSPDSVNMVRKFELSDTSRIRILSAHHQVKIFKSDLQAKSDSMFYSYSDSTMRCYVNPMIWTQGSQLSGDTIYLQLKNKKLDNMDVFPSAFVVNTEDADSLHFNQVASKKLRGYFVNDKLHRLFADGNAESIYFARDSGKISGMQRSVSSRIRVNFKDNKAMNLTFYTKPEHHYTPVDKVKEDEKILRGFIWKPKDRPASKDEVIRSASKKPPVKKAANPTKVPPVIKSPPKDSVVTKKIVRDSSVVATPKQ